MKTTLRITAAVLTAFAIGSGIFGIATAPAMAQMQSGGNTTATTPDMSMDMGGGGDMMSMMREIMANHKLGTISSIQNDEQGQPAWIVGGQWIMEMASQNGTSTSNTTGGIGNIADFHAMLQMVRLNGSAMHDHQISNFTQTADPTFDSSTNSTTITGTVTITMREGPVPNVPITIQIAQDKVIAITPDAATLENHFGNTPIYGIVVSPEMIQQMMQGSMDRTMMKSSGGM